MARILIATDAWHPQVSGVVRTLDTTARTWLSDQLKAAGFTWIANFEWGFRAFSNSRRPVNTPADIQGLKVRVPPELAIKAAFEALGANIQTIAFQEVYLALANKTVDGQDNPIATTFAAKFFDDEVSFTVVLQEDGKEKTNMHPAKIKVDATRTPATIDIAPLDGPEKGRTFPGIYKFEKGELVLVFAEKGDRPTDFSGEGEVLFVRLRRGSGARRRRRAPTR